MSVDYGHRTTEIINGRADYHSKLSRSGYCDRPVMSWLFVTLLSAFSLASADAVTKKYLSSYRADAMVLVRFTMPGLLLLPLLVYLGVPNLPLAFWGWVALVMPLEIIAMLLYTQAIRDSSLAH